MLRLYFPFCINIHNSNLTKKATLNSEVTFSGIHIGSQIPYIYCSNDGNNILFRISNGSDYVYPSVLGFINDIASLQSGKQNALNQGLLPSGANLNDYLATNVYTLAGTYSNSPVNYGILICFDSGYAYKVQITIGSNSKMYFRFRGDDGAWATWKTITST